MDEIEAMLRPMFNTDEKTDVVFPLTAVVGHQTAKRALIICLINPGLTLLIYGDRGLGKKTMLLSASNFLPEIESTGCPFNCDPHNKVLMCTDCKNGKWVARRIRMPFVLLPYTVDREMLLGSEKDPYSSILGSANRGMLAVRDMENYSKDIIDMIFHALNARRKTFSDFTYPSFFQTIATYNGVPNDVGENFVLKVRVDGVKDVEERIEILRRVELFRKDPRGFYNTYRKEEEKLRERIENGRSMLRKIDIPERISSFIKQSVERYGLKKEYERRLIIASTANAAYEGRLVVSEEDVREVHRMIIPKTEP